MSPMLHTQIYKVSEMYTVKYPSMCIKVDQNCLNDPQIYQNWAHSYKRRVPKNVYE